MEKPCLTDKDEYPDDEVLSKHLGRVKKAWDRFDLMLKEDHPSFTGEWRYYNDGKSWLLKIQKKKKTICWVVVCRRMFRTGFYFPDRAEQLIKDSGLGNEYVDQFVKGKRYGNTRGISVEVRKLADLEAARKLIEIKEQLK